MIRILKNKIITQLRQTVFNKFLGFVRFFFFFLKQNFESNMSEINRQFKNFRNLILTKVKNRNDAIDFLKIVL